MDMDHSAEHEMLLLLEACEDFIERPEVCSKELVMERMIKFFVPKGENSQVEAVWWQSPNSENLHVVAVQESGAALAMQLSTPMTLPEPKQEKTLVVKVKLQNPPLPKPKKEFFRQDQLAHLEGCFAHDPVPSPDRRIEIAAELDVVADRIETWFRNRRARSKAKK